MPAKSTKVFSVTFAPGTDDLFTVIPFDKFKEILLSKIKSKKWAICGEIASYPHYHAAIETDEPDRQDHIIRRTLPLLRTELEKAGFKWEDKHDKRAYVVKSHHDLIGLAGGYCDKDKSGGYETFGFTEEELKTGREKWEDAKETKKKRVPVTRSGLLPLMKETFSELWNSSLAVNAHRINIWEKKSAKEKMEFLKSLIIHEGYDISLVYGTLQWKCIEKSFDDIFHPEDHERFLDNFWEEENFISHV